MEVFSADTPFLEVIPTELLERCTSCLSAQQCTFLYRVSNKTLRDRLSHHGGIFSLVLDVPPGYLTYQSDAEIKAVKMLLSTRCETAFGRHCSLPNSLPEFTLLKEFTFSLTNEYVLAREWRAPRVDLLEILPKSLTTLNFSFPTAHTYFTTMDLLKLYPSNPHQTVGA